MAQMEQVEAQIKRDIISCFEGKSKAMPGTSLKEESKDTGVLFEDRFGIEHLVMAKDDSIAGKNLNKIALDYIQRKILSMTSRRKINILEEFRKFSDINLKELAPDIRLRYDENKKAFLAESKNLAFLENLFYDELGNFVPNGDFEPRHSIFENDKGEGVKEITFIVETLGSKYDVMLEQEEDGTYFMSVEGERTSESCLDDVRLELDVFRGCKQGLLKSGDRLFGKFKKKIFISKGTPSGINIVSKETDPVLVIQMQIEETGKRKTLLKSK
eukprot:CAMPEP_0176462646 /NCGR_PEP_ID=MMETSP0127-20121128/35404_1 /TAXON_ID=938130 /ORGANISM="Platyophrya macrostoma, Strain WH" /LENGTH=271 /DNA_ID=CAMNT_0017854629 /DNA_START=430 /DNA_END=1245 /DNA_ORIENTATION=+